ncbi:MAG: LPS export ABC transporter periplasmic protein LptC [Thermodesulfovibrionales bacterium]|nr:LPS export ABC transporter periplasmic protein LptC [Nitrospinota bacterium]MCG2710410.1 LPS export ABC transporter periplasmic protein LptC [Thermodesulfovibrionales bacterium]
MKRKSLLVLSLLSLLALFLLLGNSRELDKTLLLKGGSFLEGLKIVHKKNGTSMWTLNASRADIIEGSDRVKLNDVVLRVENKEMTIYSPEGFYNMESRDMTLNGKIKAVSKGYTIITESVEWNQSKGEIKTKEAVKIESKKFNVEGVGMEADSEQKVRILKNVKATFYR